VTHFSHLKVSGGNLQLIEVSAGQVILFRFFSILFFFCFLPSKVGFSQRATSFHSLQGKAPTKEFLRFSYALFTVKCRMLPIPWRIFLDVYHAILTLTLPLCGLKWFFHGKNFVGNIGF